MPFLHRLATHASFVAADVHTAFIDEHTPALLPSPPPPPAALAAAASLVHLRGASDALAAAQPAHSPFADFAFARLGGGVCGGSGATALQLAPLESDGGEAGAPFAVRLRRPSGAARDGESRGPSKSPSSPRRRGCGGGRRRRRRRV